MPYRFLFKGPDEQKFREGTFFNDEKDAIQAVMNNEDLHPEYQYGYIEIDDPNKEA